MIMFLKNCFVLMFILGFMYNGSAQLNFNAPTDNPTELGKVNWLRSYDQALQLADQKNLPVFLLFQEVPGCSNCTRFGNGAISDPFIVEAIETHFVPLVIYNNKKGEDARILEIYGEPSWNNPVVRVVDSAGKNITRRLAADLSSKSVLNLIQTAMELRSEPIPTYLSLYAEELEGKNNAAEVNLAMYCFWTGEKEIAQIPGVISTEAGFMDGREVVKVEYNEELLELEDLVSHANKVRCADAVYLDEDYEISSLRKNTDDISIKKSSSYHADKEVKYYLSKSPYRYVPMTGFQQAKVNAAIGGNMNPNKYLSPRQLEFFNSIKNSNTKNLRTCVNSKFDTHWYSLLKTINA